MTNQPPKILFLFTRPPYPANDGTKIKILSNILDAVRGKYDCTIAIVTDVPPDASSIAYLEEYYGRVQYFYQSRFQRIWHAAWWWLRGYPLQTGFFYSPSTAHALRAEFESADVVYAHTLRFGKYIEELPEEIQKKTLLDFNDAISLNYHTALRYAGGLWKYIYAVEEFRLAHYEKKLLSHPFHFSIVSFADRDYLSTLAKDASIRHEAIDVIEHGVVDDLLDYQNDHNGDLNIVFMGNMLYPPNLDSMRWFGRFLERHRFMDVAGSVFDVIGRAPEHLCREFPQILFSGFVDDPHASIIRHKLFVAPLRFGAGVQTKVLDAMALGMPVITSPIGARGIAGAKHGENIFIVPLEDEDAWQRTIEMLLGDRALRARIGAGARALIRERHTASGARARFVELVDRICASSRVA